MVIFFVLKFPIFRYQGNKRRSPKNLLVHCDIIFCPMLLCIALDRQCSLWRNKDIYKDCHEAMNNNAPIQQTVTKIPAKSLEVTQPGLLYGP